MSCFLNRQYNRVRAARAIVDVSMMVDLPRHNSVNVARRVMDREMEGMYVAYYILLLRCSAPSDHVCAASASDGEAHRGRTPAAALRQPPRAQAQRSSRFRRLRRAAPRPSRPRTPSASSRLVRLGGRTWPIFAATRTFWAIKASFTRAPATRRATTRPWKRGSSLSTRLSPLCSPRRAAASSSFGSTIVPSTTSSAWTQCWT